MTGQLAGLVAQADACNARVAGMQAENAYWISQGQSPPFNQVAFNNEAETLEHLASCMREHQ